MTEDAILPNGQPVCDRYVEPPSLCRRLPFLCFNSPLVFRSCVRSLTPLSQTLNLGRTARIGSKLRILGLIVAGFRLHSLSRDPHSDD